MTRLEEKRLNDTSNENQLEWNNICVNKERLTMIENNDSEKIFFSSENKPNEPSKEVFSYNERFTLDYLRENSFLHLKPNIYVFHGAELSIRSTKKKLRTLRKRMNLVDLDDFGSDNSNDSDGKMVRGSILDDDEEEFDSDEFTTDNDDSEEESSSSESSSEDQPEENDENKNSIEINDDNLNEENKRPDNVEKTLQENL